MKSGDPSVSDALRFLLDEGRNVELYNEHIRAAWQVVRSAQQAISIDNIVDGLENEKVELIAKLGIARAIQKAEEESRFFRVNERRPHGLDFNKFSETWYSSLTKLICENRRRSDVERVFENIEFVSFNYDRCIENYLPQSIASYYGAPPDDVVRAFLNVPIHRPYGIAGELSWRPGNAEPKGFGAGTPQYLAESARKIRTFTQGVENPEALGALRQALSGARRIVFLGSAFHRQNLELLKTATDGAKIFATCSGISDSDIEVVRREIGAIFHLPSRKRDRDIEFAKMYCSEFFRAYWRSLTE